MAADSRICAHQSARIFDPGGFLLSGKAGDLQLIILALPLTRIFFSGSAVRPY
jgi:hypothetical protein